MFQPARGRLLLVKLWWGRPLLSVEHFRFLQLKINRFRFQRAPPPLRLPAFALFPWSTKVKSAAQALLGIINDVLDFSKIEAGRLDMEKTDFRLEDVLDNLSSIVGQKAHDKNIEFLIASHQDVPPNLVGDPLRLGQILIN